MPLSKINTNSIANTATPNVTSVVFSDGSVISSGSQGFKNKIINGHMMISQRGTSFSGLTDGNNGAYSLDRWTWSETGTSTGVQTLSQDTTSPPTGFINSLKVLTTTAHAVGSGNGYNIGQWIEGLNVADLGWGTASASTVTVSFWVKSSLTGTFAAGLENAAFDTSYVFNYTISAANTWEKKTVTITGPTSGTFPTDNGRSFRLVFDLGTGSTYQTATTNAWISGNAWSTSGAQSVVGTLNATFNITGVQLEKGTTASSFEYRSFGAELQLCQRYFQSYGPYGNGSILAVGNTFGASSGTFAFQFYMPMRTTPGTITLPAAGQSSGQITVLNKGGGYPSTHPTLSASDASPYQMRINFSGMTGVFADGGMAITLYSSGNAVITISAEL
jgi:hypothetical protein